MLNYGDRYEILYAPDCWCDTAWWWRAWGLHPSCWSCGDWLDISTVSTVSTQYLQYLHSRYLGWTVDVAAATPAPRLTQRTGLHQWRWWVGHLTVQHSSAQQQPFYRETTIQMISSSWAAAASRLPQWKHFKLCLIIATSKHWILSAFNKDLKIFSV